MLMMAISLFGLPSPHGASAQSPTTTGTAVQSPARVTCAVVYQADGKFNNCSITVLRTEIKALPTKPPVPMGLEGCDLGLGPVTTKVTKRVPTKDGAILETYEGTFTQILAKDIFIPSGDRIVMKPEVWYPPFGRTEPEIREAYTTEIPAKHLRALWIGKPTYPPESYDPTYDYSIGARYFAVSIQLFSRKFHLKTAVFSGKKTTELDDGSFFGSIFRRKQVVELKDSPVSDMPVDWIQEEIFPRCAAFRIQ